LTSGAKSATSPRWSPDGQWLGFLSNRIDDKNQIFSIRPTGGEAIQLSKHDTGVNAFAWSPDAKAIAYSATESANNAAKDRDDRYSKYEVVRRDYSFVHLWTIDVASAMQEPAAGTQRTAGKQFNVSSFSWSPDNTHVAFAATISPELSQGSTSDIFMLNVSDKAVRKVVGLAGSDSNPQFSPDGKLLVFQSVLGNTTFGIDSRLAIVSVDGGTARSVTDDFDEDPSFVAWTGDGIYFSGLQKTASHLFRTNPAAPKTVRLSAPDSFDGERIFAGEERSDACLCRRFANLAGRDLRVRGYVVRAARADHDDGSGEEPDAGQPRGYFVEESGRHNHRRHSDKACRF
jgi:Tol biopolymer transport system component